MPFLQGLELSPRFYQESVRPLLEAFFLLSPMSLLAMVQEVTRLALTPRCAWIMIGVLNFSSS